MPWSRCSPSLTAGIGARIFWKEFPGGRSHGDQSGGKGDCEERITKSDCMKRRIYEQRENHRGHDHHSTGLGRSRTGEKDWPDYLYCAGSFQQDEQGNHERQNQAYAEK